MRIEIVYTKATGQHTSEFSGSPNVAFREVLTFIHLSTPIQVDAIRTYGDEHDEPSKVFRTT